MSSTVGTWSPLDLVLPDVDSDLDYKFFFVTDSGSIDGLNMTFSAGDWLVYIKENGTGNWYKTSGGAAVFSATTSSNIPEPGYYTKIRLGANANIIDADYLDASDIPEHTHDISDITGDYTSLIQSTVGAMFSNTSSTADVKFTYDSSTQTISAEVSIDDETITRNDFGEIQASGSTGSSSSSSSSSSTTTKITISNVTNLQSTLTDLQEQITENQVITTEGSGLTQKDTSAGQILSVNVDGTSILINSDGELTVNPDVLNGASTDGSSISCGSHTHTSSQITDFEEAVEEIIEENKTSVTISDLESLVDGSTIMVNSSGTLSAVGTASSSVKAHTHTMSDITDLDPLKADVWASEQTIHSTVTSGGVVDLGNATIGEALNALNQQVASSSELLSKIDSTIESSETPEPDGLSESTSMSVAYEDEQTVLDKDTFAEVQAGTSATVTTGYFYPPATGIITIYVDEAAVCTADYTGDTPAISDKANYSIRQKDPYADEPLDAGKYTVMSVSYSITGLDEGYHVVRIEQTNGNSVVTSSKKEFQTYVSASNSSLYLADQSKPENDTWVSGIKCYDGDGIWTFKPYVTNACEEQFIPKKFLKYVFNGTTVELTPASSSSNTIYFAEQSVTIPEGTSGRMTLSFTVTHLDGTEFTTDILSNYLIWNSTDVEQYRMVYTADRDEESFSDILTEYEPSSALPAYEMVLQDNQSYLTRNDYTLYGGANYTEHMADDRSMLWINLRFETGFMGNIHMDIQHNDGTAYTMNKDGTLNGLCLYVSMSSNGTTPTYWVDGNSPYEGYGTVDAHEWPGLDLYRSEEITRYVTFGQEPSLDSGYIFVKIGTTSTLDVGTVVSSIKESIDEWSE